MPHFTLFLDDGGVISDNSVRGLQWQRMVGELLSPILGGAPEANRRFAPALFEPAAWEARLKAAPDYDTFDRTYMLDWLTTMCGIMGIPQPPEEESIVLARRTNSLITSRVRADFPGAVDTILLLHAQGYTLHMASGGSSTDLHNFLTTMGIRACFGRLYGPNLINTLKIGPQFYERLLADAGVEPQTALILDSDLEPVQWASQVGAHTILVGDHTPPHIPGLLAVIPNLTELPALLESLN